MYPWDVHVGQNWVCYIVTLKRYTKLKKLQTLHKRVKILKDESIVLFVIKKLFLSKESCIFYFVMLCQLFIEAAKCKKVMSELV